MLDIATLDLFLAISEEELIEEMVIGLLASPQLAVFFRTFPRIKKAVMQDILRWKKQLQQKMQHSAIPAELASEFYFYQQCAQANTRTFYTTLNNTLATLQELKSPFAIQAEKLRDAANLSTPADSLQILFLQRWRTSLTLQALDLHHQLLQHEQEQLLAELQQHLVPGSTLDPLLADNETSGSRLWDMSRGQLQKSDWQLLTEYGTFMQQQPELENIARQLGRSKIAMTVPQTEVRFATTCIRERLPDTLPEEISGLHQSNDILRLLPTELVLLAMDELTLEFYRRLAEHKLLTYRLQGDSWQERLISRPVSHQQNHIQPRGPFIVCVDTSSSMSGFNEHCAKAFCLALLRIALADNRRCHVMLFATETIHYELTENNGLEQAARFLGQHFHGGTDLAACLQVTLTKMENREWHDADAIIISDFIAQRLPENLISQIKHQQQRYQHQFHALALSDYGKPAILHIFDYVWRFDTRLKNRLRRWWRR